MMRATGIVRRVNEDGLIPIPKAIRDRLNIGEDCYLEFFVDEKEGTITLKKYKPVCEKTYEQDFLEKFPNALCVSDVYGVECLGATDEVQSCKECWNLLTETREEKRFSAVREVITSHMQHGIEIGTELICEYNELVRQLYKKQKQPGIEFVDDLKG